MINIILISKTEEGREIEGKRKRDGERKRGEKKMVALKK